MKLKDEFAEGIDEQKAEIVRLNAKLAKAKKKKEEDEIAKLARTKKEKGNF